MLIRLQTKDGQDRLDLPAGATFGELREAIAEKLAIGVDHQVLSFDRSKAQPVSRAWNFEPMADRGVGHGAMIFLDYDVVRADHTAPAPAAAGPWNAQSSAFRDWCQQRGLRPSNATLQDYRRGRTLDVAQAAAARNSTHVTVEHSVHSVLAQVWGTFELGIGCEGYHLALLLGRRTEEGGVLVDAAYEPTQARGADAPAPTCGPDEIESLLGAAAAAGLTVVGCLLCVPGRREFLTAAEALVAAKLQAELQAERFVVLRMRALWPAGGGGAVGAGDEPAAEGGPRADVDSFLLSAALVQGAGEGVLEADAEGGQEWLAVSAACRAKDWAFALGTDGETFPRAELERAVMSYCPIQQLAPAVGGRPYVSPLMGGFDRWWAEAGGHRDGPPRWAAETLHCFLLDRLCIGARLLDYGADFGLLLALQRNPSLLGGLTLPPLAAGLLALDAPAVVPYEARLKAAVAPMVDALPQVARHACNQHVAVEVLGAGDSDEEESLLAQALAASVEEHDARAAALATRLGIDGGVERGLAAVGRGLAGISSALGSVFAADPPALADSLEARADADRRLSDLMCQLAERRSTRTFLVGEPGAEAMLRDIDDEVALLETMAASCS
jgi:hypothetical protein